MANLTETSTWEPNIYQLEREDLWDAGTGGNGVANTREKQLANRTQWLKTAIGGNVVNYSGAPLTVTSGGTVSADGTAHSLAFPIASPDFTTPNDGVTRNWEIFFSASVDFTEEATKNVRALVYTTIAGPTIQNLLNVRTPSTLNYMSGSRIVSLAPNTKIKVLVQNTTSNSADFSDMQLFIRMIS